MFVEGGSEQSPFFVAVPPVMNPFIIYLYPRLIKEKNEAGYTTTE